MFTNQSKLRSVHRWLPPLVVSALVLVACGAELSEPTSAVDDRYGVIPSPPLPTKVPDLAFDPAVAIADVDGSVVVTATKVGLVFDDSDGGISDPIEISPAAELRAVSAAGTRAALFEQTDGRSLITVVDRTSGAPVTREYELPGLVEPEAFSTDGSLLFVIDHQVAASPGAYRVRPLDLATGRLETALGPNKAPIEEDMNGSGRQQIWSPDGTRLYTLYIRQTDHYHEAEQAGPSSSARGGAGTDGFVHVLDLNEEWAFCLDLPPEFGRGDLATTALAVSPDGKTVAVADVTAGQIAFASTEDLTVTRTETLPDFSISDELQIGMTTDQLVMGFGNELHWFDQETMSPLSPTPHRLDKPLTAITSNSMSVLAWTNDPTGQPQTFYPPTE